MLRSGRSIGIHVGAAALLVLLASTTSTATAQLSGVHSGGALFTPIDASALGVTRPTSVSLSLGASQYIGGASIGLGGGAMRGYAGGAVGRWLVGGGYARTLGKRGLVGPLLSTVGGELVGGFAHRRWAPQDAATVRLTIPLGVAIGDPDSSSFGLYAAPYAESGVGRRWTLVPGSCRSPTFCQYALSGPQSTHALGVGLGTRASFGRFAIDLLASDVAGPGSRFFANGYVTLGLSYRFGA